MAKDSRQIVRDVRLPATYERQANGSLRATEPGRILTAGQEDEVQGAVGKDGIKRLVANGSLEGDWGVSVEDETAPASAANATDEPSPTSRRGGGK